MGKLYGPINDTYRLYDGHRGSSSRRPSDFAISKPIHPILNPNDFKGIGLHFDRVTDLSFRINGVELKFDYGKANEILEKAEYLEINGFRFEKRK